MRNVWAHFVSLCRVIYEEMIVRALVWTVKQLARIEPLKKLLVWVLTPFVEEHEKQREERRRSLRRRRLPRKERMKDE